MEKELEEGSKEIEDNISRLLKTESTLDHTEVRIEIVDNHKQKTEEAGPDTADSKNKLK